MGEFDITSQSEIGLGIYGGVYLTRQTPLANEARFDFGVNCYDKAFRQHKCNMKTRVATASLNFPLSDRSNASFSASKSRFSFVGEPYSLITTLGASYGFSTAAGRMLRFEMTHEKQSIIDNADQLSYETSGSVNLGIWRSKQTYASLELRGTGGPESILLLIAGVRGNPFWRAITPAGLSKVCSAEIKNLGPAVWYYSRCKM